MILFVGKYDIGKREGINAVWRIIIGKDDGRAEKQGGIKK
jgi:hypothetical protein